MTAEQNGSRQVRITVNGVPGTVEVRGDETLLETVRDRLGLTSVRYCCGIGVCGTCTVLIDGEAFSSCLMLTTMLDGGDIRTAESLPASADAEMSSVQRAFVDAGAYQCSYCIPAMALTVAAALENEESPTVEGMCEELGGNLCRCGSYPQVREALRTLVAARLARPGQTPPREEEEVTPT
jgi:aerobic-type carbon monoxide dehydrogenase small subunit (CoxS/CutS family)